MQWWNVFDWVDGTTVRVVAVSGFMPLGAIGPAAMIDSVTPVPEAALTTQVVNGVVSVVVNHTILNTLLPGLSGLRLL